jgi:hemoglobin
MTSLYERIGGKEAVEAAVDRFYEKVLADPSINHFFTNTDMTRQR